MGAAAVIVISSEGMRMAYDGGKARAGVFQWIINHTPPQRVYVELCLGDGAILRAKRPAEQTIGVEIDPAVSAACWRGDEVPNLSLHCQSAIDFIAAYFSCASLPIIALVPNHASFRLCEAKRDVC